MATKHSAPVKRYDPERARVDPSDIRRFLVASSPRQEGPQKNAPQTTLAARAVRDVVDQTTEHIVDAKSVFEVLPDTKLAMDILVSCIMSPNDLIGNDLLFNTDVSTENSQAAAAMLEVVKDHFTNKINLANMCVPALEDMLFKTGSYPVVAVPRSNIDAIINGDTVSVESINEHFDAETLDIKNIGFLSKATSKSKTDKDKEGWGLESAAYSYTRQEGLITIADNVTLADNPNLLKKPLLLERVKEERSRLLLDMAGMNANISLESRGEDGSPSGQKFTLYNKRKFKKTPVMELMDVKNVEDDEPILFRPPSEAVIPINVPGDPTHKVGYFIAVDKNGNPVTVASSKKHWDRLKIAGDAQKEGQTELERIREQLFGETGNNDIKTVEALHEAYVSQLEKGMFEALANGVNGDDVEVVLPPEARMLMLSRALGRMHTQLLYIPKELMVYMAFDYNDLGVGKSLLEATKIISSIRAMLMLANTNAQMRNSTPGVRLDIELDPKDKDPDGTVEKILALREQANRGHYPLGNIDLADIANSINRSGVEVSISNHPMYPQTKVSSEDINRSVATVDQDLDTEMRNRQLQGWGLTPEMVDATSDTDFAANIVMSNKLMVKRVSVYQKIFVTYLTDVVKLFMRLSPEINNGLMEAIREAKVKESDIEDLMNEFYESITVLLPSPDSSKVVTQLEEFAAYEEILEQALNAYFSEEFLDRMVDSDLEDAIAPTRAALKAHFLRDWLRQNNVLPELEEIARPNEDEESILDGHKDYMEDLLKGMSDFMRAMRKKGRKFDNQLDKDITKDEDKFNQEEEEDETGGETTDGDEFGTGGDDDLNSTSDDNLDDNTTDDNTSEDSDLVDDGVQEDETTVVDGEEGGEADNTDLDGAPV